MFAGVPTNMHYGKIDILQRELPTGIAYAWYDYSWTLDSPRYVAGQGGKTLAVIPERDWAIVPEGAKLRTLDGTPFTKDVDDIEPLREKKVNGYLPVGYCLFARAKDNDYPTKTCLRCGQATLHREQMLPDYPEWDHVSCDECGMYWDEPFLELGWTLSE